MMGSIRLPLAISLSLAAAGLAAGPAPCATAASRGATPDVQQLIRPATARVRVAAHGRLARAVLYEADGTTAHRRAVMTAAGITRWKFVFGNPTPGSPYLSASLSYGPYPSRFGRVAPSRALVLEDLQISQTPKISLRQAVALLRRAGHREAFDAVTLRNPVAPPFAGALYMFELVSHGSDTYVAVNARSGRVTQLS